MDQIKNHVLDNHKEALEDLQGRIQAHRAFLLLISRRLFNDANLKIIRSVTERRADQGTSGKVQPPEYFERGFKRECSVIAERLAGVGDTGQEPLPEQTKDLDSTEEWEEV